MTTAEKIEAVIRQFTDARPSNEIQALHRCNIGLKHISSGSYRNVYQIVGLPVVAKFPAPYARYSFVSAARAHARQEFGTYRKILGDRQFKALWRHMPAFYFMDDKWGVALMPKYRLIDETKFSQTVADKFSDAMGNDDWDYHSGNFGYDKSGNIVILDLGCLEGYQS